MIRNAVIIGLGATLLTACVPVQQPKGPNPPAAPAPQTETTSPAEPAEGQPLAPVDVRKLTCRTLTGATDDDKAYATSFLMGYRSALIHSRTIEIKRIEAVEEAALADCSTKPDALATKVFAAALAKIGPGGEIREPPRVHHGPPSQAMPGAPSPEQPPPAQPHEPPIQYTPAQTTPTSAAPPPQAAPTEPTPPQTTPAATTPPQPTPTQAEPSQATPPPAAPGQTAPPAAPAEPPPAPKPEPGSGEQK